jgi:hypothetical protein
MIGSLMRGGRAKSRSFSADSGGEGWLSSLLPRTAYPPTVSFATTLATVLTATALAAAIIAATPAASRRVPPRVIDEPDDDLPLRQGLARVRGLRRCR